MADRPSPAGAALRSPSRADPRPDGGGDDGAGSSRPMGRGEEEALARELGVDPERLQGRLEPARAGRPGAWPPGIHPRLALALADSGAARPHAHQEAAWRAWSAGREADPSGRAGAPAFGAVVIATGTGSGKTLAFAAPLIDAMLRRAHATALVLAPTRALGRDLVSRLAPLADAAGLGPGAVQAFDGDAGREARGAARARARLLVANPDALHHALLPSHPAWGRFWGGLEAIVLDEAHAYAGVFGSHVGNVVRRARRVAALHGAAPRAFLAGATLRGAREHAARLVGVDARRVRVIERDDAPFPGRRVAVVETALLDAELGLRERADVEAARVIARLARSGRSVLGFAGSRQGAERLRERVERLLAREGPGGGDERPPEGGGVRAYRAGLRASERRAIEAALRDGGARVVIATSALEVGVDVGGLDAVVQVGWPGGVARLRQRFGRAGRRGTPGLGVLVLGADPLERYLAARPARALDGRVEEARCDPAHEAVLLAHLRCALFESPLGAGERFPGHDPDLVDALLRVLVEDGEALPTRSGLAWIGPDRPAAHARLRGSPGEDVALIAPPDPSAPSGRERAIGTLDRAAAPRQAHPGATYLHDGRAWRVRELDLEAGVARLEPGDPELVTDAYGDERLEAVTRDARRELPGGSATLGDALLRVETDGYAVRSLSSGETIARRELDLPPVETLVRAVWITPSVAVLAALRAGGRWSSDANRYGPGWDATRAAVRARDGHRCRACGRRERGRAHDVHHLRPFRASEAGRANEIGNLVLLCRACHLRAEAGVRARGGLAGAAYALSRLASLPLACAAGDVRAVADHDRGAGGGGLEPGLPSLALIDTAPGGVGLAEALYERVPELLAAALERIDACACSVGCPSCTGAVGEELPGPAPGGPGAPGKRDARALLAALRGSA